MLFCVDILKLIRESLWGCRFKTTDLRMYPLEDAEKFPDGNSHDCDYKFCLSVISVLKNKQNKNQKTHTFLYKKHNLLRVP